jgi:hypothetical protein
VPGTQKSRSPASGLRPRDRRWSRVHLSREPYRPVSPPRGRQGIHIWPDVRSGAIASDPNASRSGMSTGSVRNPAFDTESLPDPMISGGAGGLPERRTRAGAWHWQFMNIGPGTQPCVMLSP